MDIIRDEDVVRGLGYVSLCSARLEAQVNRALEVFAIREEFPDKARAHPISQRLDSAIQHTKSLKGPRAKELLSALIQARDLFQRRNEVVHGCIYDAPYPEEGSLLHSTVPGVAAIPVSAESMYQLAEEIRSCQAQMDKQMLGVTRELAGVRPDDA